MTLRELLGALGRRWYVLPVFLIAAAALGFALLRAGGVYSTRTVLDFFYPHADALDLTNDSGTSDKGIIGFAGVVAQQLNDGRPPHAYADSWAPLYGAGVRESIVIGLENFGGQWTTSYPKAEVDIQIVGRSEEWVRAQQTELTRRALDIAAAQQASAEATHRISVDVVPVTLHIDHVAASRQPQATAGAALLLAATIVGVWASVKLDRSVSRRRTPAHAPAAPRRLAQTVTFQRVRAVPALHREDAPV